MPSGSQTDAPRPRSGRGASRRAFLGGVAAAVAARPAQSEDAEAEAREERPRGPRPQPPYRVWFQPRLFDRNIDLYRHMTVDASGWLDPRLADAMGKTALDWVYGLQHPWADGPDYWRDACLPKTRRQGAFVSAGIAVDEWVPPKREQNPEWLAAGLRAGKEADPEVFVAVWITDPTPPLTALVREGTIDLVVVEGYTHLAPDAPAHLATSWEGGLRRCQAMDDAGLIDRTIYGFGHVTPGAQRGGDPLTRKWLRERAKELRERYPKMPGVAFFQRGEADSSEFQDLIRACDEISGEFWPDSGN